MDMRLVPVDQQVMVALGTGQQVLPLPDEGLPLCGSGPTEQLLGLLPGQVQTVQSGPDRLATTAQAKALAHPADQAPQRPSGRGIGTGYWGAAAAHRAVRTTLPRAASMCGQKGGGPRCGDR